MKTSQMTTVLIIAVMMVSIHVLPATAQPAYRGEVYSDTSSMLKNKFTQKQRRLLKNREKLGLSDSQVEQIRRLKSGLDKESVMKDAQIKVIDIDLTTLLAADTVDMSQVKQLINQKFEIQKAKTLFEAQAYADLKSVLQIQQKGVLKNLREIYKGPYNQRDDEE